jgi:hypothetical protein
VKLRRNALPFFFLPFQNKREVRHAFRLFLPRPAHCKVEVAKTAYQNAYKQHQKPEQAEIRLKFLAVHYFVLYELLDKKALIGCNKHMGKPKFIVLAFISIAGAALNIAICYLSQNVLTIPLFLDTIFTMTLTFYGGVFWGVLTGALTNLVFHSVFFVSWPYYLYTFCNIAVALVTALFIRWFPRELSLSQKAEEGRLSSSAQLQNLTEKAIILILLSFALCIVISILGGIFSTLINIIETPVEGAEIVDPGKNFRLALQRKGFPAIMVEIASRIPVNILDRLISSFAGCGIAMLLAKKGIKKDDVPGRLGPEDPVHTVCN